MLRITVESGFDFDTAREIREAVRIKRGLAIPAKVIYKREDIEVEITELTTEQSAMGQYIKQVKRNAYEKRGLESTSD